MECKHCCGRCVRNGRYNGKQKYRCTVCGRGFVGVYTYRAYRSYVDPLIQGLIQEGCGIRGIARRMKISKTTVQSRIVRIAATLTGPQIEPGKEYEIDEMHSYVGSKSCKCLIVYAMCKGTRQVPIFNVGPQSNDTLKPVTQAIVWKHPRKIYTDGLSNYLGLIPKHLHDTRKRGTNGIERMHLMLRTKLKRLNRSTICFSKSMAMLKACVQICLWG